MREILETDGDAPNPKGTAERLLSPEEDERPRARRGRPPGRKTRRAAPAAGAAPESERAVDMSPPTEVEIAGVALVWGVLWELLAVRMGNLTPISAEEQRQLAAVTVPVIRKYVPIAGEYGAEIALLVTVGGVVFAHLPKPEPAPGSESGAEVIG